MFRRSVFMLKVSQHLYISSRLKLHTSAFPVLYSRFEKDLPNPNLPTPASKLYGHDTDILLEQLKKCGSLDKLLDLTNMHLDVMNSKHVVTCLESFHNFVKSDKDLAGTLLKHPTFKALSSRLMKVIRLFEPDEVITVYKLFCALEVRNNTYVMQSVLKMLGAHMNNMNLGQLTFLSFLLHKQRHNSLVDGLRLALPLVLQVQIDQQLDSDNLRDVVNCLQLSCRSGLKPSVIQKIVNVVTEKASVLATNDAVTVVFALLNNDAPVDGYKELMDIALEIISRNIHELSNKKIISLLRICRNQHFYHFKFFFTVADLIVLQKWDLEYTYSALSCFYHLGFCPSNILDHFADVLCSESNQYQSDNSYSPLSCIEYLTATSYHPVNIDGSARVLYSSETKLESLKSKGPHLYMKFLCCLAMLGHFPHDSLSKMLDEEFLFHTWNIYKKLGRGSEFECYILSLLWSLKIYDETESFTIPPTVLNKAIHTVHQKHLDAEYPLTKFIGNGLGGSQFLLNGVFTEDGHIIDHVLAMRNGNYPVSLQKRKSKERKEISLQDQTFVEDLILPEDAKIIAVIVAKEEHFLRDPEILKGWIDLKVRSLVKRKYATVVVNYNLWNNLPDREKIPYLMREIKQVIPDDCALSSNFS